MATADAPTISFGGPAEFERWLEDNHTEPAGIWMKLAKVGSGVKSITYKEALEVALCFGWIDGQSRRLDDRYYLQRWTPRRKRSIWSQINRDKVTALIASGRMRPSGLAEVERAKADGRWERAYAGQKAAEVPIEILKAFDEYPEMAIFFESLNRTNRYAYLHRFHNAKKPETRAKLLEMMREGRVLYPD